MGTFTMAMTILGVCTLTGWFMKLVDWLEGGKRNGL